MRSGLFGPGAEHGREVDHASDGRVEVNAVVLKPWGTSLGRSAVIKAADRCFSM
jgi:hypothetical protein